MIRIFAASAALGLAGCASWAVAAEPAAPVDAKSPAKVVSVDSTQIGDFLDNPELKAILIKHLPQVANGDQIEMARAMTLRDIQPYAPDFITDKALADIETDLKARK
ncbi:hypothetical protein [Parafrankia sp. BMG5.11]|uniref:hypothetical protein n=1 Tax=Parafrankia sp. BMG5.11 TaxID=222540 RepID=UPI00103B5D76|nr:hypothetical protein [Parafrankia sp. BMG5.11]TCJ37063.1 hypothetical protein E0504_18410 [Parafrankia sp. BMG5.11]